MTRASLRSVASVASLASVAICASPFALVLLTTSCGDPAHTQAVDALGPEPGGGTGPEHRPGQPCMVCHGGSGPGVAQFIFAGTIYKTSDAKDPAAGADVALIDAAPFAADAGTGAGVVHAKTNAAGNFYVPVADFAPTYPVHVFVTAADDDGTRKVQMTSHIGRDGSCAGCHTDPAGSRSPGHVFLPVSTGRR
jgi:hypothetical protein